MQKIRPFGPKDKTTAKPGREEKTILVVEDDRTHRSLMEKILSECGFSTAPAENGLAALARLEAGERFDLIIMDWDMPELNGLETVREIRARQARGELPYMPVIAFTGYRRLGDREQCLAAGMDAYLPKDAFMPKWREVLFDNLQGLLTGDFDLHDFAGTPANAPAPAAPKADAFDARAFSQTAELLKDELPVAVEEYLEDAANYIREIRAGLDGGDAELAARGSHPLKSNSKGFGLEEVSQIAKAINESTREGDVKTAKPLLPQLQNAFAAAEKWLRAQVKKAGY